VAPSARSDQRAPLPVALVLLLCLLAALPAAAGAQARPLQVRDGRLVDGQGRQVVLHGVNVVFKRAPYLPAGGGGEQLSFTDRDVRRLRGWGMNTIRLGITWKAVMPRPGVVDDRYLDRLVATARRATRHGLYVLLDMHQDLYAEPFQGNGAPEWAIRNDGLPFVDQGPFPFDYLAPAVGRAFTSFWADRDRIRTRFVRSWTAIARRFVGQPRIVGYDLFNEPACEVQAPPCGLPPRPAAAGALLQPFYDALIPAVRRADPTHPVFYEDWITTDFGFPFSVGLPPNRRWPYPGQGLSYHVYCGQPLRPEPCPQQEEEALRNAVAAARRNRVAPLLTEFGATDDLALLGRLVDLADRFGQGWQYWSYKTYDDPTTQASSGPGGADAQSIVAADGAVKAAKLRLLARAYPRRIAGTGARWSFVPESGRFALEYRPRGLEHTEIVLPAVHYAGGAVVRVRGGTAHRGRGVVRVRPAPGVRRVTVTARPR